MESKVRTKVCTTCKVDKPSSEFSKRADVKSGLQSQCKRCKAKYYQDNKEKIKEYRQNNKDKRREYNSKYNQDNKDKRREYRQNNKEKIKEYRQNNKDKMKDYNAKYRQNNKDKIKEIKAKYYQDNKDKIKEKIKEYRQNNKDKRREYNSKYERNIYHINTEYRLRKILRSRLRNALKNNQKQGSAVRDLGCSISSFRKYIEDKFYPHPTTGEAMSWDNLGGGHNTWQLDHILEFQDFDISVLDNQRKLCHYTNIQPLWYCDHVEKSNRRHDK